MTTTSPHSPFPTTRLRRLRRTGLLRDMVRETQLDPRDFIYPLFVVPGRGVKEEIPSMPEVYHFSVDTLVTEAREVQSLGIPAVLLFGLPSTKDDLGSEAYASEGIVQQAVRALKDAHPRSPGHHRRLPLRIHGPRPLRRCDRWRGGQRPVVGAHRSDRP